MYCDSYNLNSNWSNKASGASCDDELWCNGTDTCDATGNCNVHQYPGDSRCDSGGICDNTCNEAADNCYSPAATICSDGVKEYRCSSNDCGGDAQSRTLTTHCTGVSAECNGTVNYTTWQTDYDCDPDQECNVNSTSSWCVNSEKCDCTSYGDWYDSNTGLCWENDPAPPYDGMPWDDAYDHCLQKVYAGMGAGWRMPDLEDLVTLIRGCNGGTATGDTTPGSCTITPSGCGYTDSCTGTSGCDACTVGDGPDTGSDNCYWDPELQGNCGVRYWSSSTNVDYKYYVDFSDGNVSSNTPVWVNYSVRCVRGGL